MTHEPKNRFLLQRTSDGRGIVHHITQKALEGSFNADERARLDRGQDVARDGSTYADMVACTLEMMTHMVETP